MTDTSNVTPISDELYASELRQYRVLREDDPTREDRRQRLAATMLARAQGLVASDDYEGVVTEIGKLTDLYTSSELETAALPKGLGPVAKFVVQRGSKLGDEGRVLSALLLLQRIEPDQGHREHYQRVARWGMEARTGIYDPHSSAAANAGRPYVELIRVWGEHATLTPTLGVLEQVATLYKGYQTAVIAGAEESTTNYDISPAQVRRISPFEVAGWYLAEGEIARAIEHLEASRLEGGLAKLLDLLKETQKTGDGAADALATLVEKYRLPLPTINGLCVTGAKRFERDYRFPQCLARVATSQQQEMDAAAWYADAIRLAPNERNLYDEALIQLDEFIRSRLVAAYPQRSAELARGAERILAERQQRWPKTDPPIELERLHFLVGMLEMNAGNTDEAARRFEESLKNRPNTRALIELGSLLERTGKPKQAEARYRKALSMMSEDDPARAWERAQVLTQIGDAKFFQGQPKQATKEYEAALKIWTDALEGAEERAYAWVQLRRGVLLDRLGQHEDAVRAFRAALAAAGSWPEAYQAILSHAVTAEPDLDFARWVWNRAQLQLDLPLEWKVYYALWLNTIAARAGESPNQDALELLRRLAKGKTWWSQLARLGAGELDASELLQRASGIGERTEAHYYAGTRLLGEGDAAAARSQFERVLDTNMVSFYEYEMARRLLHKTPTTAPTKAQP